MTRIGNREEAITLEEQIVQYIQEVLGVEHADTFFRKETLDGMKEDS